MAKHDFRVVQRCPVPRNIAPYIAIVINDAHATLNSAYRGDDARQLLNKYGHSSQVQLYDGFRRGLPGYLPANPPGHSTHELKSDGIAYPSIPSGHDLAWWMLGFDVNDKDVGNVERTAARYGWKLHRPYPSGSEFHHLNFLRQPHPTPRTAIRILRLRATLPRH